MKKLLFVLSIAASCAANAVVNSAFHNASHYFRSLGDVNGNGVVDEGEVVDMLTWSSAKRNVNYPVTVCGTGAQIQHTNLEYTATYPARTTIRANGIYFPQPVTTNLDGSIYGVAQTLCVTNATNWGTTNSFRVHFRWHGPTQTNFATKCWIMRYGCGNLSGLDVYIETTAGNATSGYLRYAGRSNNGGSSISNTSLLPVTAGKWYDLIVSRPIHKNSNGTYGPSCDISIYLLSAGDVTESGVREKVSTQSMVGCHSSASQTKTDIIFGGYETVTEPTPITSGDDAAARAFRGIIDAYECWDAYMPSNTQLREIISGNHGAIATIGLVNGKADEFSDDDPAAVFDCDTMEWRQFRKTLTAVNPSVSFKVNLGSDVFVTNWPQVVSLTPLFSDDAPESCPVEVYINGTLSQRGDLRTASGRALYIGAKYMKPDAEGNATFEIRRTGDLAGSISLDAVAVCGGGSIGRLDESWNELGGGDESYYAVFGDRNAKNVKHSHNLATWTTSHDYFAFYVPEDSIGRETYKGLLGIANTATYQAAAAFKIYVNGTSVLLVSDYTAYSRHSFDIPANLLKPGLNEISINGSDVTGAQRWTGYDCIQLWAEGEEYTKTGLILFVR